MLQSLTIRRPDDWHLHLRGGSALAAVLGFTTEHFARALIMPNLKPPVTNWDMAWEYYESIRALAKQKGRGLNFKPLMTLYLTDKTTPEDIAEAKKAGLVIAAKLYPANATTNSAEGVTDIKKLVPVFRKMAEVEMVLCIHGETLVSESFGDDTRNGRVGQLRREAVFLKESLKWIVHNFPSLKIVLEHITTREAVRFVEKAPPNVAATITAHHLLETLDAVFESHHNKCMPTLKEEPHRQALLDAATSGNPKFFAGTDSAPHAKSAKETACGCAGCFTAIDALALYATAFEERHALNRLEGFLSDFGADFYGLSRNTDTITIRRQEWKIPNEVPFGDGELLVPFWAGRELHWKTD
ncbi:MAG: dihydroorotase [Candidatus Pacebacteria bacterium]|nr:dihydroorotase [Candidatus Paceibacterota bacterium]MCF7857679.1 dihydroorotase [Candidatus Paceibacterota bacterium]